MIRKHDYELTTSEACGFQGTVDSSLPTPDCREYVGLFNLTEQPAHSDDSIDAKCAVPPGAQCLSVNCERRDIRLSMPWTVRVSTTALTVGESDMTPFTVHTQALGARRHCALCVDRVIRVSRLLSQVK